MHTTKLTFDGEDYVLNHNSDWSGDVELAHNGRPLVKLPGVLFVEVALHMIEGAFVDWIEEGQLADTIRRKIKRSG